MSSDASGPSPGAGVIGSKLLGLRHKVGGALARIGLTLVSVLITLLLIEVILRVAFPILPDFIQYAVHNVRRTPFGEERIRQEVFFIAGGYGRVLRHSVDSPYRLWPSTIAFSVTAINWLDPNSHVAFRVPSEDWQPVWPVDAVVLGDSFTFCVVEYSDCWVQILASEYGMSVVNEGQPGTGTISHLRIMETFALPYQPRFVLWQWYGNDYNDDFWMDNTDGIAIPPTVQASADRTAEVQTDSQAGSSPHPLIDASTRAWLQDNSAIYALVNFTDAFLRANAGRDPSQISSDASDLVFSPSYLDWTYDMESEQNAYGWQRTQESLLEARDRLAQTGTPLVIVLIPSKEEVYRRWSEPIIGSERLAMAEEGRLMLLDFCRAQDIRCFDLTDVFTAHAEAGQLLYYRDDIHLNPHGNGVMARAVWEYLVSEGLVGAGGQ